MSDEQDGILNDFDKILSVLENPTRRKILQAVVREPHYPLQLSKELGVSQQAVTKNLNIMERNGIVISSRQNSDRGAKRILYRPSSEFTVIIDLRNGMFETDLISESNDNIHDENKKIERTENYGLKEARQKLSRLDTEIDKITRKRSELIRCRNELIGDTLDIMNSRTMDYVHRNLLYDLLDHPDMGIDDVSDTLGVNVNAVSEMVDDIIRMDGMKERVIR